AESLRLAWHGLWREREGDVRAGREEGDVDPVKRLADGLADLVGLAVDRDRPPRRPAAREQTQLPDGELALVEDLDHRPADDAGGADNRDGEGGSCSFGPVCPEGAAVAGRGRQA